VAEIVRIVFYEASIFCTRSHIFDAFRMRH
jgi:hypothetical protein